MTDAEIEAFLSVRKCGGISTAAETLFVSQPALSRRLKALETELGCRLFVRDKGMRDLRLTPEGEAFVPLAESWRDLLRETKSMTARARRSVLRIGAVGSLSTYLLPRVLGSFMKSSPETDLVISSLHDEDAYDLVAERRVDLALVDAMAFSRRVETAPIFRERMVLVVSGDCALPERVHPGALDREKEILINWEANYMRWHDYWFGVSVQPRVSLDNMSLLEYFLAERDTWAIMPISAARRLAYSGTFSFRELEEAPARTCYCLRDPERSLPAADGFLEELRAFLRRQEGMELLGGEGEEPCIES